LRNASVLPPLGDSSRDLTRSQSNIILRSEGDNERIEAAVEKQTATGQMFAGLLRERGYEVDNWPVRRRGGPPVMAQAWA
jgi:hypothetical protein